MENYQKGKNVEEPLERDKIPITDLPINFLWMQVRGGSKIRNLLTHALNELPEARCVVWTGFGPAVGKTITCAEIMKREYGNALHQVTKICYRLVEEFWDPKVPELDQIVVKRKLPMIHIMLSMDPVNAEQLGYQAPGMILPFEIEENENNLRNKNARRNKQPSRTPTKEFSALGMDAKKRSRKSNQYGKNNRNKNMGERSTEQSSRSNLSNESSGVVQREVTKTTAEPMKTDN